MARTVNTGTDPHAFADPAMDLVRTWLLRAQENQRKNTQKNPAEDRLAAVLQDPNGLEFTVGFVDRVVRTEDGLVYQLWVGEIATDAERDAADGAVGATDAPRPAEKPGGISCSPAVTAMFMGVLLTWRGRKRPAIRPDPAGPRLTRG